MCVHRADIVFSATPARPPAPYYRVCDPYRYTAISRFTVRPIRRDLLLSSGDLSFSPHCLLVVARARIMMRTREFGLFDEAASFIYFLSNQTNESAPATPPPEKKPRRDHTGQTRENAYTVQRHPRRTDAFIGARKTSPVRARGRGATKTERSQYRLLSRNNITLCAHTLTVTAEDTACTCIV